MSVRNLHESAAMQLHIDAINYLVLGIIYKVIIIAQMIIIIFILISYSIFIVNYSLLILLLHECLKETYYDLGPMQVI